MSDFTIQEVLGQETFTIEGKGDFTAYTVRFDGSQGKGVAQHKRKASSPAPTVGETFDAEIIQNRGKSELKRIWAGKPAGGSSNGGGFRGDDPKREARIVRQHSQHMAILWAATLQKEGGVPVGEKSEWLRKVIDWFDEDVNRVSQ